MGHTVSDLIATYVKDRMARGVYVQDRARNARSILHNLADFLGNRRIENVGESHIEDWLASMEHLAPATRRDRLSTVRAFYKWAVRRGYAKRNPAATVDAPRQPRRVPRALTAGQIRAVLDHAPDARGRLIILLMTQEALRCCSVSRLTVGDIDLNYGTLRVVGKGHHEQILPLSDETRAALDDYLDEWPASAGPLVRSYRQCHRALAADTISGMVAQWMWEAGIKRKPRDGVSAHACRHTAATDMLRGGAHLRDVQAALGHASIKNTEVYLPLVVKGLAEAMGGRSYR
jgi:site-specific recombinase XerD